MKISCKSVAETADLTASVLAEITSHDGASVVALRGDLGSGKTAFTQALAKHLGVNEHVTSPTFVIEKIYRLQDQKFSHLIHIDAYRIEKSSEMLHLGWKEIIEDPKNLIVVEWPERIADILPTNIKKIEFTFVDEGTREIEY